MAKIAQQESEQKAKQAPINPVRLLRPVYIKLGILFAVICTGCIVLLFQVHFSDSLKTAELQKHRQLSDKKAQVQLGQTEHSLLRENYASAYRPLIENGYIGDKHRLDLVAVIERHKDDFLFNDFEYRLDKDIEMPLQGNADRDKVEAIEHPGNVDNELSINKGRYLSTTPVTMSFGFFDLANLIAFIDIIRVETPGQLILKEWQISRIDDVANALNNTLVQFESRGTVNMTSPLLVTLKFDWNMVLSQGLDESLERLESG